MKLKMDKSSYKSAENYLGKGEKATVILAEPQVLRQWDDVAKKYTDTVTGYKYTFTFDGAEDVLVVKFANKQDIKQWDVVTFENLEVFEDIRKMQRISARKEYVSMDRPEICEVARRTIDNVLGAENSSYTNTFKVELEADRLLFIPLVPTPLVVDEELNKNSIML